MPRPKPSPIGDPRRSSSTASVADLHARVEDFKETLALLTAQFEQRFNELRQHFQEIQQQKDLQHAQRFEAQQLALRDALTAAEKAVAAALAAAEKAVAKAEVANEKRFESVNEFRKSLSDQATLQMPRSEAMTLFAAQEEKIRALSAMFEERMRVIATMVEERMRAINKIQDMNTGKGTGVNIVWVGVAAVITVLMAVLGTAAAVAVVVIMLFQNHKP